MQRLDKLRCSYGCVIKRTQNEHTFTNMNRPMSYYVSCVATPTASFQSSLVFLKLGGGMFQFIPHYSSHHFHNLNTQYSTLSPHNCATWITYLTYQIQANKYLRLNYRTANVGEQRETTRNMDQRDTEYRSYIESVVCTGTWKAQWKVLFACSVRVVSVWCMRNRFTVENGQRKNVRK